MLVTKSKTYAFQRVKLLAKKKYGSSVELKGNNISSLLSSIPILTKFDLTQYMDRNIDEVLQTSILFSETSGSTGNPLMTPRSSVDLSWNVNNQIEAYRKYTQAGADRVAIMSPNVLSPFIEASAIALSKMGVGYIRIYPIPHVCDYRRMMDVIDKYQITTIMTTPTLLLKYLYESKKLGRSNITLKTFLLTGERISINLGNNIKRILGRLDVKIIPFVYGSSETATLMYGTENFSYKSFDNDFIFELVNKNTNNPALVNVKGSVTTYKGKLLVTWLRDGQIPIIRYDTGDNFELIIDENKNRTWNYIERNNNIHNEINEINIEEIIYNSELNIFHFTCKISNDIIKLEILVCDIIKLNPMITNRIKYLIIDEVPDTFSVDVKFVDFIDEFDGFNVPPKLMNFHYDDN